MNPLINSIASGIFVYAAYELAGRWGLVAAACLAVMVATVLFEVTP